MEKAAVVIPFDHCDLTEYEQISFCQCLKILGNYPIILIVPSKMDEKSLPYQDNVLYEKVPDEWLESIKAYNRMMLSEEFYKRFLCYEYILIYQLDAFVFYDQLKYFCNMEYDYIGAPWLYGAPYYLDNKHCVWYVGNGGFSLRRVSGCIRLLYEQKDMLNDESMNEDLFFSMGMSNAFKVAPVNIALKFSFEQEIEKCFRVNNQNLPFGCHAWTRYHFAFWKQYIEQFGYKLELPSGHDGEDDEKLAKYYEECRGYAEYMERGYHREDFTALLKSVFGKEYTPVSIWGAGIYGREMCALLTDSGIEVDYFVDSNCEKYNTIVHQRRVVSFESFRKRKGKVSIIIAVKRYYREVAAQLEKYGYRYGKEYIFYQDIMDRLIKK